MESIGHVAKHVRLGPDVDSAKLDVLSVLADYIFPELGEIVAIFLSRVINLDYP